MDVRHDRGHRIEDRLVPGRALEEIIDREMDQLTERALATFGAADRAEVIRALQDIRRNLAGS